MSTNLSVGQSPCLTIMGEQPADRQWQVEGMKTARQFHDIHAGHVFEVCFVNSTGRRVQ